jgi:hypothetical protein
VDFNPQITPIAQIYSPICAIREICGKNFLHLISTFRPNLARQPNLCFIPARTARSVE